MSIEVRGLGDQPMSEELLSILEESFAISRDEWRKWAELLGLENMRVAYHDDEIVGGLGLYTMGQYFGGTAIPMTGIAGVAAAPARRGLGTAAALMESTLRELHDEGIALSALHPATQGPYRKVGYEQAGDYAQFSVPLNEIGAHPSTCNMTRVDPQEQRQFHDMYKWRATHLATNGQLDRNESIWLRKVTSHLPDVHPVYAYVVGDVARPEGYIIYHHRVTDPHGFDIVIRDWVCKSVEATRTVWRFLAGQRSLGQRAVWYGAVRDPALLLLPEQRRSPVDLSRWMLRIVRVQDALEQRGYDSHVEEEVHLEVRDPLLDANNGTFVLSVAAGKGTVRAGGRGDLQLSVSALAPLYSSLFSAQALFQVGKLSGTEASIATASRIFAGPDPWFPDMF